MPRSLNLYLDLVKKEKQCGNCFEVKSFAEFSMASKKTMQARCKKCRSRIVINRSYEKKIELFPELYNWCDNDDCFKICKKNERFCFSCRKK